MGIPAYGDTMRREIDLANQQVLAIQVIATQVDMGCMPELHVTMGGKEEINKAVIKAALNSPNDLRYIANMLNQMANRVEQINEEARDDYYEDED